MLLADKLRTEYFVMATEYVGIKSKFIQKFWLIEMKISKFAIFDALEFFGTIFEGEANFKSNQWSKWSPLAHFCMAWTSTSKIYANKLAIQPFLKRILDRKFANYTLEIGRVVYTAPCSVVQWSVCRFVHFKRPSTSHSKNLKNDQIEAVGLKYLYAM